MKGSLRRVLNAIPWTTAMTHAVIIAAAELAHVVLGGWVFSAGPGSNQWLSLIWPYPYYLALLTLAAIRRTTRNHELMVTPISSRGLFAATIVPVLTLGAATGILATILRDLVQMPRGPYGEYSIALVFSLQMLSTTMLHLLIIPVFVCTAVLLLRCRGDLFVSLAATAVAIGFHDLILVPAYEQWYGILWFWSHAAQARYITYLAIWTIPVSACAVFLSRNFRNLAGPD